MTLLLRTVVVLTILVVFTNATPPPGYIKQPNNDENPPSYRYKYAVEDETGDGQGKAETREGELASGRYFVNSKRASTDVKYIADEWGYHPLVKYGSSDDHSSFSASFAIGEKAVQDLQNENNGQSTGDFLKIGNEKKIVQIIQPYHLVHRNAEENGILNLNKSSKSYEASSNFANSDVSHQAESNFATANALHLNYIVNVPQHQQQIVESVSSSGNDVLYLPEHQSSTIQQQQSDLSSSLGNDLTSTVSEDQLVVENAGSFGQRLQVQGDDALAYSTTTTTASPIPTHAAILSSTSGTTRGGRHFHGRVRQKNSKPYLPDTIPGLGAYSSTTFSPLDNSVTANSIEHESSSAQGHTNNGIFESSGLEAYSTSGGISVTTPNPLLINYSSQGVLSSASKAAEVTTDEKKEYGFSKPIVVPDVPKERPFQYSTTFECEDDDVSSSTADPLAAFKDDFSDSFGETWSSHILNPIQAGVALLNAGEAHLIDSTVTLDETPPAPVNEQVEDTPQSDQSTLQQLQTVATQATDYVGVNPAFGDQQQTTPPPQQQQSQQQSHSQGTQQVDVQKSIELYPSSPNHEIHYTQQPANVQATHIDQQQQTQAQEGQQQLQQYLASTADLNSKQEGGSRTRGESLTKVYEISDNYPKDSADIQPVYVVQPATYIVEDSSVLKNSLLQEKIQQYQTDVSENDNSIKSEQQQQLHIEVQDGVSQQPHYIVDTTGVSYNSEVTHEQQQKIAVHPEANVPTILEKTVHVPHGYPVEKIIEKKVPYPVEKIIEKKIPVPHPYPIPIEVPVPQPYPVHIEKVVEKKVPVPVHIPIPHPIPVEKPVHIPVPIEKIVEKPVHIPVTVEKIIEKKVPVPHPYPIEIEKIVERKIPYPVEVTKYVEKPVAVHAPYGVKYGVSYQQIMKPQNHGLYSFHANSLAPLYALPISNNLYSSSSGISSNNIGGSTTITKTVQSTNDISSNHLNHSQAFQGYYYEKPSIPFIEGGNDKHGSQQFLNAQTATKKLSFNSYAPPSYPLSNTLLHRRHTAVHRPNKSERDDYFGPVPPLLLHPQRQSYGFQSKASFAAYPSHQSARKSRNHEPARNYEPVRFQKGNFRQSKIEYGFKPPMVPSVQYDEETASKVES